MGIHLSQRASSPARPSFRTEPLERLNLRSSSNSHLFNLLLNNSLLLRFSRHSSLWLSHNLNLNPSCSSSLSRDRCRHSSTTNPVPSLLLDRKTRGMELLPLNRFQKLLHRQPFHRSSTLVLRRISRIGWSQVLLPQVLLCGNKSCQGRPVARLKYYSHLKGSASRQYVKGQFRSRRQQRAYSDRRVLGVARCPPCHSRTSLPFLDS